MTNNDVLVERLDFIREDVREIKDMLKNQQDDINQNKIEIEKIKSKSKAVLAVLGTSGLGGIAGIAAKLFGLF